jgi:hypothetical protein
VRVERHSPRTIWYHFNADFKYDEDILEVLATFGPPSSSSCATHSKSQMSNSGSAQSSKYSSVPSSTFGSRPNSSGLGAGGIDTATGSYTGRSSLHSHSHSHTHTQSQLQPFDPQKVSDALCRQARSISEQTLASTPFMERAVEVGIDFVGGKKDGESTVHARVLSIPRGEERRGVARPGDDILGVWLGGLSGSG